MVQLIKGNLNKLLKDCYYDCLLIYF